jgi:amidase
MARHFCLPIPFFLVDAPATGGPYLFVGFPCYQLAIAESRAGQPDKSAERRIENTGFRLLVTCNLKPVTVFCFSFFLLYYLTSQSLPIRLTSTLIMKYGPILSLLLCHAVNGAIAQQSIRFEPTTYHREFSSQPAPVLRIQQGDTIHSTSVDAVGVDRNGNRVTERGNPLTGPFFAEGAEPGDVLAVTLLNVSLNRNFATTLNTLIPKVLPKSIAKKTWRAGKLVRWQLDLANKTGRPVDTGTHLQKLVIPLHPFLGCVGVAPAGSKGISTRASGPYGGNLDFSQNTTGATIYLPVFHAGALLYLGDGHAAQGDGELNGDALETSMNFSFLVRVLKKESFPLETPMVEDEDYLMFFGIESSLDKSLKVATESLNNWLQVKYKLTLAEASQVIGPVVQYRIPKIAATKVEVVALMPKKILKQLEDR